MGNLRQRIYLGGGKYKHNFNENPPPGYYNPELGDNLTRNRSSTANFSRVPSGYKVYRDENPEAGDYEPNKGKEGREMGNLRQRINFGGGGN